MPEDTISSDRHENNEWYSRGYLPHREKLGLLQSITFRLADSLPLEKLQQLTLEMDSIPEEKQELERRLKIEEWLDSGMGCCAFKHPDVARCVQDAMLHFDGDRYALIAWCIMPNHVHVLIEPKVDLSKIVQSWKSFTGRWIMSKNTKLQLGVPGKTVWMREYWNRYIRNHGHFHDTIHYIHNNPVKAGLCEKPEQWPWSSARNA